jgi:hypothetical protein
MWKIDVSRHVREMESVLRWSADPIGRTNAIAILRRWQFDDMLDDASRQRARMLVREFATSPERLDQVSALKVSILRHPRHPGR